MRQLAAAITESLGQIAPDLVAPKYGIPQPRYSELSRGIVDRCSVEWMIKRIYDLGGTVRIEAEAPDAGRALRVKRNRASAEERIARGVGSRRDEWIVRNLR